MTRCIRVCGAYSFRLSRRHSTVLLIASFIVTITVILQLYSYRHQGRPYTLPPFGDFDYRPGGFLKGKLPNENKSYCEFNYGLPETLKWEKLVLHASPEVGSKSPYRVIYNAVQGRSYVNYSKYDAVTYATQATPEFLYHIVEIARYWDGPISVSVFVPSYDLDITMQLMAQLCHCYTGMSKVSLHLFYPKKYPPKIRSREQIVTSTDIPTTTANITIEELLRKKLENYRNLDDKTRFHYIQWVRKRKIERMTRKMPKNGSGVPDLMFTDCSGMESLEIPTFRRELNMIYPINVGRNVARNASTTNYFLASDIEMVPSDGLAPKFLTMVRKLMGDKKRDEGCVFAKTVFVVPLFEVERGEEIPHDKDTLVRLIAANRAMYFHQKLCSHCQRFPGLQSWLMRPSPGVVEPMLIARREYPYHRWEPLYFGTHKEPWYSEILSWEGRQDKMTQVKSKPLSKEETKALLELIENSKIITSKTTNATSNKLKDEEWYRITEKFNATATSSRRLPQQLRLKWENLKKNARKRSTKIRMNNIKMLELCLQEYRMVVLDGAFLCHAAASKGSNRHSRAEKINTQRYMKIIGALKQKYPDRPQCKVNWGC